MRRVSSKTRAKAMIEFARLFDIERSMDPFYFYNPHSGDDTNSGFAITEPIRSPEEWRPRLIYAKQ